MNELISGFLCCDLVSKQTDAGPVYKLSFNAGRLVMAILLMTASAGVRYIW